MTSIDLEVAPTTISIEGPVEEGAEITYTVRGRIEDGQVLPLLVEVVSGHGALGFTDAQLKGTAVDAVDQLAHIFDPEGKNAALQRVLSDARDGLKAVAEGEGFAKIPGPPNPPETGERPVS